jgi:hypothetical protein
MEDLFNALHTPATAKQNAIADVYSMISLQEYMFIEQRCKELYGLHVENVQNYKYNIKSIMARKHFTFTEGLSAATKAFQLLHVVGHYHFMTSASRKGVRRYEPIYSTFGNASLHVYEESEARSDVAGSVNAGSGDFVEITDEIRVNRILFEMGANKYAILILDYLGMKHIEPLVKLYEPADISYLIDITSRGRPAIVETDFEYIDKYVCSERAIKNEPDLEGVYDADSFRVSDIDWPILEKLKLEFHFF